jgi:hypothetical protein
MGQEITVAAPEARAHGQIIDLMQALKQNIEKAKPPHQRSAKRLRQIRNTPKKWRPARNCFPSWACDAGVTAWAGLERKAGCEFSHPSRAANSRKVKGSARG